MHIEMNRLALHHAAALTAALLLVLLAACSDNDNVSAGSSGGTGALCRAVGVSDGTSAVRD